MDGNRPTKDICTLASSALMSLVVCFNAQAFELLSEGAMDSVSAVSAESAEDIINIAGSPAAGLTVDGYEQLPFQARISVGVEETDEVEEDLNYDLVREVEAWADELRNSQGSGFEVGFVEELPQTQDFESQIFIDEEETDQGSPLGADSDDETRYQVSRVEQTFRTLNVGPDTITYQVERYIERAATVDADPFDDGRTVGSGYITDIRSSGEVTLTAIRNDRPLF